MITVLGMVFERHGKEFPVVSGGFQPVPIRPSPATTADPCNNVALCRNCAGDMAQSVCDTGQRYLARGARIRTRQYGGPQRIRPADRIALSRPPLTEPAQRGAEQRAAR